MRSKKKQESEKSKRKLLISNKKRDTSIYSDLAQENLMKELRALDRNKRANINEHRLKERFSGGAVGNDLRKFNPDQFDEDLVNFYLKEPVKLDEPSFGLESAFIEKPKGRSYVFY